MITRIYVDNYKCFSNFELTLDSINLLLGLNGSGKTSIFSVLRKLREFVSYQSPASELFYRGECTRIGLSIFSTQTFELDMEFEGQIYRYRLQISFNEKDEPNVLSEQLFLNDESLLFFRDEQVRLFDRDSIYPLDATRSATSLLPLSPEFQRIITFRQLLEKIILVQITPSLMELISLEATSKLSDDARNLVSWYRYLAQEKELVDELKTYLQEVLPNFSELELTNIRQGPTGEVAQALITHFVGKEGWDSSSHLLSELSDGQRSLLALYMILVFAKRHNYILCIDEPENFLALAEIQPWLIELYDLCSEGKIQALLISHHPEVINYLGEEAGIWFERPANGPAIVHRLRDIDNDIELPMAEIVARGWLNV